MRWKQFQAMLLAVMLFIVSQHLSYSQNPNPWTPGIMEVKIQCLDLNDSLRALGLTENEIVNSCELFVNAFGFKFTKAGENTIVVSISSPVMNQGKEYVSVKVSFLADGNSTIAEIQDSDPLLANDLSKEKLIAKQLVSGPNVITTTQELVSAVMNKAKMAMIWKRHSMKYQRFPMWLPQNTRYLDDPPDGMESRLDAIH